MYLVLNNGGVVGIDLPTSAAQASSCVNVIPHQKDRGTYRLPLVVRDFPDPT